VHPHRVRTTRRMQASSLLLRFHLFTSSHLTRAAVAPPPAVHACPVAHRPHPMVLACW
jgi:hypothetical protein